MTARRIALPALALLLWSCATTSPSPFGARVDADAAYARLDRAAERKSASAEVLARAGWLSLFRRNDAATAEQRFEAALVKDPTAALAHLGLAETARARLDERAAARAYLALIERAPGDPLAELALSRLPEVLGVDAGVDAEARLILAAVEGAEAATPRVRAAAREVLADVTGRRGDLAGAAKLRATAGGPAAWTVVGPLSAHRALDADVRFAPESGALEDAYDTPLGTVHPRTVPSPGGTLSLASARNEGDVYYALADVTLPESGTFLLAFDTDADLRLSLSGTELVRRDDLRGFPASEGLAAFEADAGTYRLVVRIIRGYDAGRLGLRLLDAAGRPAEAAYAAPKPGPAPEAGAVRPASPPEGLTAHLAAQLAADPTDGLAAYLGALHLVRSDLEAAKARLAVALAAAPDFAHARRLEARVHRQDPGLTRDLRTGRGARALLRAAKADPTHASARVRAASIALAQSRYDDAEALLAEAAKIAPAAPDVVLAQARLFVARGLPVLARRALEDAARVSPTSCALLEALHRARAGDQDLAGTEDTAERLRSCGVDGLTTWADLRAERGDLELAARTWAEVAALTPGRVRPALRHAELLLALGRHDDAARVLEPLREIWPDVPLLPMQLARIRGEAGDLQAARRLRAEALRLAPADLDTRRALAFHEGRELVDWGALDLEAEIAAHAASGIAVPAADAVMVVDHAAIEVAAEDPSRPVVVERVQTVVQVLTKNGIDRHGEVAVPDGAQLVAVYNRKPDGRILQPEDVVGKDRISLPGLEAGDYVVVDYLVSHGPRTAAMPGWTGNAFYFRVFDVPLMRSSYVVRAPRALGLEIEAHGFTPDPVREEGEHLVFRHEVREVPWIHAEPDAVGADEVLPWVRVGAGAGPEAYGELWGDYVTGRARPTFAVRRFAEEVRAGLPQDADTRALVLAAATAVDAEIRGGTSSTSFGDFGAQALARGRGNRLLALRSVLEVLGVPSRVALVRPFSTDPSDHRFPAGDLYTHAVLRVDLGGGEQLWLDQNVRTGPLGVLREIHSDRPALLLAEPGAPTEIVRTPAFPGSDERKDASIRLELDASGDLVATGREVYVGFSGALVRSGFEQVDDARRRQAIESGLSRTFGPIELLDVTFEGDESDAAPGTPFAFEYRFRARGWARKAGDRLVAPGGSLFPALLSRRLIRLAERETPLLMDTEHAQTLEATFVLPEGLQLAGFEDVELDTDFGRFFQRAEQGEGEVVIRERLDLALGRVPPERYVDLARFCAGVDTAQARDLVFRR